MMYLALIAVVGILFLQWTDAFPHSSVGGPMMIALTFLVAALSVGVYEAWSNRRGVVGWLVNIVCSFVGGLVAALFGSTIIEAMMPYFHLEGSLAQTRHPLLYITSAAMMLITLLGAWAALAVANRWR